MYCRVNHKNIMKEQSLNTYSRDLLRVVLQSKSCTFYCRTIMQNMFFEQSCSTYIRPLLKYCSVNHAGCILGPIMQGVSLSKSWLGQSCNTYNRPNLEDVF